MPSLPRMLALGLAAAVFAAPPAPGSEPDVGATKEAWAPFQSEEGRFRVLLPSPPVTERDSRDTWLGPLLEARYFVDLPEAGFVVEHHDLPGAVTWFVPSGVILDRAAAGLVEDANGSSPQTTEVTHQGHPARRVRYEADKPRWVEEALVVLAGHRLYVLIATHPSSAEGAGRVAAPKGVERFFRSFELWEP